MILKDNVLIIGQGNIEENCPYCGRENAKDSCDCILSIRARTFRHLLERKENNNDSKNDN